MIIYQLALIVVTNVALLGTGFLLVKNSRGIDL
jgi:hypothetical protein